MEERLQKILAAAGIGSRRQCEEIILQGRVTIDGEIVTTLGTKANTEKNKIKCDGEIIHLEKKCCYLFYKPRKCLCTNAASKDPRVIDYFASVYKRLFPVGRLEKDAEGVMLVTNDGDLAQKLSHPRYKIPKVYRISVRGRMNSEELETLRNGLWTKSGKLSAEQIYVVKNTPGSTIIEITLQDGRNLEIHRLFTKIGHPVSHIIRIQYGPFKSEELKPGEYRLLSQTEIEQIFSKKIAKIEQKGNKKQQRTKEISAKPNSSKKKKLSEKKEKL